jgi:hypothetical protein
VTADSRTRLGFRVAVAVLVAWFVSMTVVRMGEPFGMDQGCFACFARWLGRGWLPYRDVFDSKAPLFVYSWTLVAAIPGSIEHAAWWFEAVWLAATLGVAYFVAARTWGRGAGLAAAALLFAGLWSPAWGGYWSRAQSEELLAIPMMLSAWLALRAVDRAPLAFWAGVLGGIAGCFKIPSMAILLAWVITWIVHVPVRELPGRVARLVAGAALPWALVLAWFAAHHATRDLVDAVFVYQRHHARYIAPPWGAVFGGFTSTIVFQATLLLVAAAGGLVLLARRRSVEATWLGAWTLATMAAIVAQRQLASYHYLLAMPPLALAGAYGLAEIGALAKGAGRPRAIAAAAGVALVLLGAREAISWWRTYSPDAAYLAGRLPREVFLRGFAPQGYAATEEDAARYLREHSSPSDGVLVWGLSPGIYALADRPPATRYVFHKLLVTDAPVSRMWPGLDGRRAAFMDRLRAQPPLYVLVGRGDANGFETDSYTALMRFGDLHEFVQQGYHVETTIGRFLVYRRGAAGSAP